MKGKKLISALLSAFLLGSVCNLPLTNAAVTDSTNNATEEKTLIYRKSVNGKNQGKSWDFTYALTAYDNGLIHIDVQCEKSTISNCNQIGNIQFDDSMIASIGENGNAGKSSFDNHNNSSSKYTTSFADTEIIYTSIYSDGSSYLSGSTLMSFDLYVKEKYLTTNQKMTLFGEEIEIPFGNPPIDKDAKIEELEAKVSELETTLNSISRLDADNDGAVTSVDASIILWIYAYNSTHDTPITTFDEYNNALKQE